MLFFLQIITLVVALSALFLVYILRWRDYRLPQKVQKKMMDIKTEQPKISIIIPAEDQATYLDQNLPKFLEQDYPSFEIIVVNIASSAETNDVLERHEATHKNLRHTFVPQSSRYIDRQKLAITLGIRAAHSDWCVLTSPDCHPTSTNWLKTMVKHLRPITMGYANYEDDGSNTARRAIYERLCSQLRFLRAGQSGRACGADGLNLIISKQLFLDSHGFVHNLELPFGEKTLLVDELATTDNVAFVWNQEATLLQELPNKEVLSNERMHMTAVKKHLSPRAHWYARREGFASFSLYLFILTEVAYIVSRILESLTAYTYELKHLTTDIPAFLLLLCYTILPITLFRQLTTNIGARRFGSSLHLYTFLQPFRTLHNKIQSLRHEDEFTRPII